MSSLAGSKRVRRVLQTSAVVLILAGLLGVPAAHGDEVALGGYQLSASAAGIAGIYDQPSAGLASGSELSIARTIAKTDSGPAGRALASAVWPGEVAASAGPVVSGEAQKQGAPTWFEVPAYPVRAESFYPQGPERQQNGSTGVTMISVARQDFSDADAATSAAELPDLVHARNVASSSTVRREGVMTISEATSTLSHIEILVGKSLLGGTITIDSLVTTARATSDGLTGKVSGGVRVTGLKIAGNEASIDEKGVHFFGAESGPIGDTINELARMTLEEAGITLALAGPIDIVDGASSSRTVGGLVIGIAPGKLGDQVPEGLRDLSITIVLGGATVMASASRIPPVPFSVPIPTAGPTVAGSEFTAPASPSLPGLTAAPPPAIVGQPTALAAEPIDVTGVPAALVGLFIALALAGSRWLRLFADRVTAARAAAICPLEER